jgi:hypothetical protein
MTMGNMQYGMNNNAGSDLTALTSTATSASTATSGTLNVDNTAASQPAIVGRGIREGHGVFGESNGHFVIEGHDFDGAGVFGQNIGGGHGVRGVSDGIGVVGLGGGAGVVIGTGQGVVGIGASTGVEGNSDLGDGVDGFSGQRNGVQGVSGSRVASGVYGENLSGGGFGVAGRSNVPAGAFGAAVFGDNTAGGPAGLFKGIVIVAGTLSVIGTTNLIGTIFKPGGGFRIDHPLDAPNSYLQHSFVESPDMMNVYNGNVTTDADGNAVIELPSYFEALNRDFRYQLTVIGQFAQAIVAEEVRDNHFSIRTDKPNVRVSWQVTGIRQDAWANAHRVEVEQAKPDDERGRYLAPEEHGQPATAGLYYTEVTPTEGPPMSTKSRLRGE